MSSGLPDGVASPFGVAGQTRYYRGRQVITELQLDEEIRVTDFLNKEPIIRDTTARRAAADRLVQQLLIRREMDVSRYPLPTDAEVDKFAASSLSSEAKTASPRL